jgi:hypothetical protein
MLRLNKTLLETAGFFIAFCNYICNTKIYI